MLFVLFILTVFGQNSTESALELKPQSCTFKNHQQVCTYNLTGENNKFFDNKPVEDTTFFVTFANDKDKKVKHTFKFNSSLDVYPIGKDIATDVYCYDSKISKPVKLEVDNIGKEDPTCANDGKQCYFGRYAFKTGKTCPDEIKNKPGYLTSTFGSDKKFHLYCCVDDAGSGDDVWLMYGHYVWQPYTGFFINRHEIKAHLDGSIEDDKGKKIQIKDNQIEKNFPTYKRWFMKQGENGKFVTADSGVDKDAPPEEFGTYSGRSNLENFKIQCVQDPVHRSRNVDIMSNSSAINFKCNATGVPSILKDNQTPEAFFNQKKGEYKFGLNIPSYEVTFDVCESGYEFKNNKCEQITSSGSSNLLILALLVALLLFI